MPYTTNGLNRILSQLTGGGRYLALLSSVPADTGLGYTEPTTAQGYSRISCSGKFGAPVNGVIKNSVKIRWTEATNAEGWGTLTHVAICNSLTPGSGNVLYYAPLAQPVTILKDQLPKFVPEALQITVTASSS